MKLNGHQWLMSNIVAEQEAEAARRAEIQSRLKAIRDFVPRRITPVAVAKTPAPAKPAFRVTNELLNRHDAMERKARLAEFREAAGSRNFAGLTQLINAINTTNF